MDDVSKLDSIKYQVKQLIERNLYREVTPETKYSISGIYMIYIDNFTSEKIVPIYIGQAKDIQKRFKQHFSEILALNRLPYEEYNKYFFINPKSFYEGNFKACKIFKYMLENNCTLKDFHMIVIEEAEEECLEEKEQDYFDKLLPSFFGFNQLNSFLKQLKFRVSNSQIGKSEIAEYLNILQEDIKNIYFYYEYGFTRFNFEHAMTKDISFLLKGKEQLDHDVLLKFEKVKSILNYLCKLYIPNFEKTQKIIELNKSHNIANEAYKEALELLNRKISEKLKELGIYDELAFEHFIYSIEYKDRPHFKKLFYKYLKSQKCKLNFHEIFDEQIKDVNKKSEEKIARNIPYSEALELYNEKEAEMRPKRYKMIFPSNQFKSFSLGDRTNNLSIKFSEDHDLSNTCHIQIYISNDGINRSLEYDIEPFIIRFDYCYIDKEGNKIDQEYYIDNELTRKCQSGIEYFEKDFYNIFAFKKVPFKISSFVNKSIEYSFISIPAEYKHGINDYTLKDKQLIKLSIVLDEIRQITNEETRFNIDASESLNCFKKCIIIEGLQNDEFVEHLLLTKKFLKLNKRKKTPIKKANEDANRTISTETNRLKGQKHTNKKILKSRIVLLRY